MARRTWLDTPTVHSIALLEYSIALRFQCFSSNDMGPPQDECLRPGNGARAAIKTHYLSFSSQIKLNLIKLPQEPFGAVTLDWSSNNAYSTRYVYGAHHLSLYIL